MTKFRPENDDIGVDGLRLDPDNPRFVTDRDTADLKIFLPWFHGDADLLAVGSSIAANGYHAAEPLLVAPRDDGDDRLVVVEGNRRFAAVLVLLDPELLPRLSQFHELSEEADLEELRELPCLVYESRDQILDYLGNRHVVGVKEWKPLAKARYVKQLQERAEKLQEDKSDKALARRIGSNAAYVRRLLNSLQAFESVELKQAKDEARFSILQTALQYNPIADWVGIGARTREGEEDVKPDSLQELADWTLAPSDPEKSSPPRVNTRRLPLLADVVGNDEALAAFRRGETIERAHRLTDAAGKALLEAMTEAGEAMGSAVSQADRLTEPPSTAHTAAMDVIQERTEQLSSALDAAESQQPEDDESSGSADG
ncbi:MAG TPA: hypothetical protein VNC16_10745 [Solirubrobacterales bacterium]|jgi:hypothetical protein|nr:hypothetical protein [Solirubrobacterales bacterium]